MAEILALLAGLGVTAWWLQPWSRLSTSGTLKALLLGWDNDSHFDILVQNLKLGSFVQARPDLPGGGKRIGYDYPQGMHQAWALLVRLINPHPPLRFGWLLHTYVDLIALTSGVIVLLACMAVVRVSKGDLLVVLPVTAIVVALFGVGRFGPFTGYPNFDLAVAAAAIAISLMIRATLGPIANLVAIVGLGLVVVYNWYPLILLVAPALVVVTLQTWARARGRVRAGVSVFVALAGVAYVLPALTFLHRGVSSLNSEGGLPSNPSWSLVIASLALLICVAGVRRAVHLDRLTSIIIAAPAVIGGTIVILVASYTSIHTGSVSYYGEKIAEGVFGVSILVLAFVIAGDGAHSRYRRRVPRLIGATLAVFLSVAALQVDGYVGPAAKDLQTQNIATGISIHSSIVAATVTDRDEQELLLAAQRAQDIRKGDLSEQWWYVDPSATVPVDHVGNPHTTYADFGLLAEWFDVLLGDTSVTQFIRSGAVIGSQFDHVRSAGAAARLVIKDFPMGSAKVHLVVPRWLEKAVVRLAPAWRHGDRLVVIPYVPYVPPTHSHRGTTASLSSATKEST